MDGEIVVVSKCLLGYPCRYDGRAQPHQEVLEFGRRVRCIGVCPEQLGGLMTPRPPCEIQGGGGATQNGQENHFDDLKGDAETSVGAHDKKTSDFNPGVFQKSFSCTDLLDGGAVLDGRASVQTQDGQDYTAAYLTGAERTLALCRQFGVKRALLKSKSPSCGSCGIYDGSFTKTLLTIDGKPAGQGVTAALLACEGIEVFSEENTALLLSKILKESGE